jgi:hypothetical protein
VLFRYLSNHFFVQKMNLEKINEAGPHRQFDIHLSYSTIVEKLGEPHVDDDPNKVDASWHVVDRDTDRHLAIWNYKNGPAYIGEGTIEDVTSWSAWGDESLAHDLFGTDN